LVQIRLIFLVIVVTDTDTQTNRQTHKPTPVKTYSVAFAGRTIGVCGVCVSKCPDKNFEANYFWPS